MTLLLVLLVGWERRARDPDRARRDVAPGRGVGRPGDRWLMAAAITFGVGLANHFLTLLFVPGIALYVLAVEPGILRRVGFVAELLGMLLGTTAVLYLELPLRAGAFPAPLVYGHPDTVGGFLYVVLALQFLGTLSQPFAHLGGKVTDFVQLGLDQLGFVALLVPIGFLATAWRRPRYALLTGVTFVVRRVVRGVLQQRRHRALLPRAAGDRAELGRGPCSHGARACLAGPGDGAASTNPRA